MTFVYVVCTTLPHPHAVIAARLGTEGEQKGRSIFAIRVEFDHPWRAGRDLKEDGVAYNKQKLAHILIYLVWDPVATMGPGLPSTSFHIVAVVKARVPPTLSALPSISTMSPAFARPR